MGGTIYKLSRRGDQVAVAFLASKADARKKLSSNLADEERSSMQILGVSKVYHADFPNIKMNTVPQFEVETFVESCINNWNAEAIVTHHSADVNIDHRITSTATMAACRLSQRNEALPQLRLFSCVKYLARQNGL